MLEDRERGGKRWEEMGSDGEGAREGLSAYFHVLVQKLKETEISEFEPGLVCCYEGKCGRVEG